MVISFIDMAVDRRHVGFVAAIANISNKTAEPLCACSFLIFFSYFRCYAKCRYNETTGDIFFENLFHNHGCNPKRKKRQLLERNAE